MSCLGFLFPFAPIKQRGFVFEGGGEAKEIDEVFGDIDDPEEEVWDGEQNEKDRKSLEFASIKAESKEAKVRGSANQSGGYQQLGYGRVAIGEIARIGVKTA